MPCNSTYCISNTGLVGADDNYITGGTYNGDTYWTGQTSGWTIYYYTGVTSYWCLSDTLGGTCYLTGKYPCVSNCPDLSNIYVFSGACPTPTPTPTQNCDVLDFTAIFDCEFIPTPTQTPSATVTPTMTMTPSSTNFCSIIGIDAIGYTFTSTPTPTPTVTPTQFDSNSFNRRLFYSKDIVRDCDGSGFAVFSAITGQIICPGSLKFQDCYNGEFYFTNEFILPEPLTLEPQAVFGVYIDGEKRCATFLENTDNSPLDVLIYETGPWGYVFDEGACVNCQIQLTPTPTPTPTQTKTPTPTPTPTSPITSFCFDIGSEGFPSTSTKMDIIGYYNGYPWFSGLYTFNSFSNYMIVYYDTVQVAWIGAQSPTPITPPGDVNTITTINTDVGIGVMPPETGWGIVAGAPYGGNTLYILGINYNDNSCLVTPTPTPTPTPTEPIICFNSGMSGYSFSDTVCPAVPA